MTRTLNYSVTWLVDKRHVADAYEVVSRDISERCKHAGIGGRQRSRLVTDAVIQHRRNRNYYLWVML